MDAVFFPRNDYPNNIEICNHRFGKKITFCELTTMIPKLVSDMLLPYIVELNRTHNIRVSGYFDNKNNGTAHPYSSYLGEDVMDAIANNVIFPSIYFLSNPQDDYSEQAILDSKNVLWEWFYNKFGRKPSTIVYGLNPESYGDYLKPYLLSCTSEGTDHNTDYGIGVGNPNNIPYSINRYYKRNETVRALDGAWYAQNGGANPWPPGEDNYQYYINLASTLIDETMALENGGLITSFCHWHNILYLDIDPNTGDVRPGRESLPAVNDGFKAYFNMLAQKNANDEIYFSGYGEAIEYLVFRESISKAVMYSPVGKEGSELVIRLEALNVFNIDTDLLQTPISIKFSTIGTPLAGKSIRSDNNMIDLGNNQYIIEIPWSKYPGAVITENNL